MKPTYSGFEAKKASNFIDLPPVGAYAAEIRDVRLVEADGKTQQRDSIEMMIEITEGEYKGRYMEVYTDQKERFGDTAKYKGVFRLVCPLPDDEEWRRSKFESSLWCVEQSNGFDNNNKPLYRWDWDEKKLKGKKVGINVRKRLYRFNGQDRETTEIGQLETIADVKNGKCKPMRDRDTRGNGSGNSDDQNFTDVSREVSVPW